MVETLWMLELPVVFIRYNPDTFKINLVTTRIPTDVRLKTLKRFVDDYINSDFVPESPLEYVYLYYNCNCSNSSGCSSSSSGNVDNIDDVATVNSVDKKCGCVHYGMKL